MISVVTSRNIDDLDPAFQPLARKLLDVSAHLGTFITDGARTMERQDQLYEQGRTTPGPIVTQARPGESYHNYGLAIDIAFQVNGRLSYDSSRYLKLFTIAREIGIESLYQIAGFDMPHFQYPNVTIEQLIRNKGLASTMPTIPAQFRDGKTIMTATGPDGEVGKLYLIKDRALHWANPDIETAIVHGLNVDAPDYWGSYDILKTWPQGPQLQFKEGWLLPFFKSIEKHGQLQGDLARSVAKA